ncbi:MAG: M24 family metallopeptidase [Bryobacteraceae bacterium]
MLTPEGCARRRERLFASMVASGWPVYVTRNYRTTYYFTGTLTPAESPVAFVAWADGRFELVTAETYSPDRCVTQPFADLNRKLAALLPEEAVVVREDRGALPEILALRRRKEPDEIGEIRESLRLCAVAYDAAREAIRPGATELDVYLAMHAAISRAHGAVVPFPGDFACGERCVRGGGLPTTRVLAEGDLYILDLFPAPALYFGDTCRTFAVGGNASARQHAAWEAVMDARRLAESLVRPGVPAREVHAKVKSFLDAQPVSENSFWHHSGHGIGHDGHEAPRIMTPSSDVFEEGDVIALEPGVYSKAIRGGVRLEDNYIVRAEGLERLFEYRLEL